MCLHAVPVRIALFRHCLVRLPLKVHGDRQVVTALVTARLSLSFATRRAHACGQVAQSDERAHQGVSSLAGFCHYCRYDSNVNLFEELNGLHTFADWRT